MAAWASEWVRRFTVDETTKHAGGFTIYRITSVLFPIKSPEAVTIVSVWKRYSDIQKLHKNMKILHSALHLKGKMPEFKQGSYFKRFDPDVIEERKVATKRFLEFVAEHRLLFTSAEFVNFLQTGYPEPTQTNSGVINSIRTSLHLPIEETPPIEYQNTEEEISPVQPPLEPQKPSPLPEVDLDTKDDTALDVSEIEIFEAANVEFKMSPKLNKTESFESLSSWGSGTSNFYDEVDQTDLTTDKKKLSVLPDLINFDEPSTSRRFDDYHTMDKTESNNSINANSIRNSDTASLTSTTYSSDLTAVKSETSAVKSETSAVKSETSAVKVKSDSSKRSDSRLSLYSRKSYSAISCSDLEVKSRTEDSYVFEAGYMLNLGARCEDMGDHLRAFECYKAGIEKMLIGVQSDTDPKRRCIIKEKTNKYLSYAENIYRNHLGSGDTALLDCVSERDARLERDRHLTLPATMLSRPYEELGLYRVLCVLPPAVMMVLHKQHQQCYAMKVIQKIPNNLIEFDDYFPKKPETKNPILPTNVPYMVQLKSFVETPNLLFLILDYAPGGKLFDYIANYVKSIPNTPAREVNLENVFAEPVKHRISQEDNSKTKTNGNNKITCNSVNTKADNNSNTEIGGNEIKIIEENATYINKNADFTNTIDSDISVNDLVINSQRLLMNVDNALAETVKSVDVVDNAAEDKSANKIAKVKSEDKEAKEKGNVVKEEELTYEEGGRMRLKISPERCLSVQTLPPSSVCKWGAELLMAIEHLHNSGVVCRDLHPSNLLLGDSGHLLLTYFIGYDLLDTVLPLHTHTDVNLYIAPELYGGLVGECGSECDWWSYGAVMYEMICGVPLSHYHKSVFTSHTILQLPQGPSLEVDSLLTQLLTYDPAERLGSRGVDEIKRHPYFKSIDWQQIYDAWVPPE